jgi:asparagine synthetase B (glutamine-hydrolysing)
MFIFINDKNIENKKSFQGIADKLCRCVLDDNTSFFYSKNAISNVFDDERFFVYHRGIPVYGQNKFCQLIESYKGTKDKKRYALKNGNYLIVLYDKKEKSLKIYRDAWGTVPVYYYKDGSVISNSIGKIARCIDDAGLNMNAVAEYLASSYVVGSETLYEDIFAIDPLCMLELTDAKIKIHRNQAFPAINHDITEADVIMQLEGHIDKYIKDMASVIEDPKKYFISLSGGTDSSLLVAKLNEVFSKMDFVCGLVEYRNWHRNDTIYFNKVVKKYDLKSHIETVDNESYTASLLNLIDVSRYVWPLFGSSFNQLVKNIANEYSPSFHINGTGPDEAVIGFERVSIEQMRHYDKIQKNRWVDTLLDKIDYFYTSMQTLSPCIRGKLLKSIKERRRSIAEETVKESEMFSEFQRRYSMQTTTDFHIRMLYDISSLSSMDTLYPYCTQELFDLLFQAPYYLINSADTYKYIFKKVALKYYDHDFVFRPKIGFHSPSRPYFRENKGLGTLIKNVDLGKMENILIPEKVEREISIRLMKDDAPLDYFLWTITTLSLFMNLIKLHSAQSS